VPVQQEAPTCVYYWVKLITKYDSAKNSRGSFTSIDKHLGISSMNMLELEEEEKHKDSWNVKCYLENVIENGEPPDRLNIYIYAFRMRL
jgi:hypothetical protein